MTQVASQDSNFTELRYALEVSPGVVDSTVTWQPLEPNDYKDFGGDYKTKARNPINPSRQRKKGVLVDLDAAGGFTSDVTPSNFQDIGQTFLFAALRKKAELAIPVVDGTANGYSPTSGGAAYVANDLLFAKGMQKTANNGLKLVTGTPTGTSVLVTDTGLVDEAGSTGTISKVGHQFAAGVLSVSVAGTYPIIVNTSVGAVGTLTASANFADAETVVIGGKTYTMQATLTNVDGHVKIGATLAASLTNLKNAINRDGNGVPGTDFAVASVADANVSATSDATHLVVTALVFGTVGNAITTTETATNAAWGGATLASGTGLSLLSLGLIPGEMIYVGGDGATEHFFNAVNGGFCRTRSVTNNALELDKTQFTMVADNGTIDGAGGAGQTIRIFCGRVLKNEATKALITKRYVQLERALGAPDDASPTQIQGEYLTRALGDSLTLDGKTADILKAEYNFMAGTHELNTGVTGLKAGARPNLVESDAFNTTSDVSLIKMAVVSLSGSNPTPLFAYLTDMKMTLKNNLKQKKAISVLGAFDVSAGTFEVAVELTAYFGDVSSIVAVKNNSNVTFEVHFAKANAGVSIDLPLLTLAKARAEIKQDEPVTLPLTGDAATGALVNSTMNHTMMMVFFDYLPTAAG